MGLKDIAKKVGVSKALVSIVLNDRGDELGVNKTTQQQIKATAKDLNYRPNQLARSLRLQKSNTIGLILPNITDKYFSNIASSIEKTADQYGYQLIISTSHEDEEREQRRINMLIDRGVDGLIITPSKKNDSWVKQLIKSKIPFVLIDRHFSKIDTHYVVCENYQGAYEINTHLLKMGYQKIAQLTLIPYMDVIAERNRGYRDALKQFNIRYSKKLVHEISLDRLYDDVKCAMQALFKPPVSAQAIFTHNNVLAEYVLQCASEMKLRIPRDFALVSFGDQNLFKSTNPAITSVKTPDTAIGQKAMEILQQEITGKLTGEKVRIMLPTEVVLRESCGRYMHNI